MKPDLRTVPSELPDPPYPADTKAGAFAFDLEVDRMLASDTWALTLPEVRPWCLMSWTISWALIPCGSLPDDDDVIVARLGCSRGFFDGHRKEIMRGWMLHNDGRLYHPVITEKVLNFLGTRKKWSGRKRKDFPSDSTGTPGGIHEDSNGNPSGVLGDSPPSSSSSSSFTPTKDTTRERSIPSTERSMFDSFWKAYPKKIGKKACAAKWKSRQLDAIAEDIVADVRLRIEQDGQWLDGFVPNPLTYINGDRWNDEIQPRRKHENGNRALSITQQADRVFAAACGRKPNSW